MSEELALGQRELTAESTLTEFSAEEKELLANHVGGLLLELVKASGNQTINVALAELSQNAAAGLAASAKAGEGEPEAPADEPADAPAEPPAEPAGEAPTEPKAE